VTGTREQSIEQLLRAQSELLRSMKRALVRIEANVNSCIVQYHDLATIVSGLDSRTAQDGKTLSELSRALEKLSRLEEPWLADTPVAEEEEGESEAENTSQHLETTPPSAGQR